MRLVQENQKNWDKIIGNVETRAGGGVVVVETWVPTNRQESVVFSCIFALQTTSDTALVRGTSPMYVKRHFNL